MTRYVIVKTDSTGSDYPNEKLVTELPVLLNQEQANLICAAINAVAYKQQGYSHPNYWKVEEAGYVLQPGFEP